MGGLRSGDIVCRGICRTSAIRHLGGVPPKTVKCVKRGMTQRTSTVLTLLLLAAACLSLSTILQPRAEAWSGRRDSGNVLKVLLGDGRRLFANHFFVKADVYFHSGYYPSIFDQAQAPKDSRHLTSQEGSKTEEEHEKAMNFLRPPKDWIERFGRHFLVTEHTHLSGGKEREMLPWLRLSAE